MQDAAKNRVRDTPLKNILLSCVRGAQIAQDFICCQVWRKARPYALIAWCFCSAAAEQKKDPGDKKEVNIAGERMSGTCGIKTIIYNRMAVKRINSDCFILTPRYRTLL
jgi:hypothetical protein